MSGTTAGGKQAAAKNKAKYGEDFYSKIGTIGGSVSGEDLRRPKGFAGMSPEKRRAAGIKGGEISRK